MVLALVVCLASFVALLIVSAIAINVADSDTPPRFSLRTLLIAVAILSCLCFGVVVIRAVLHEERQAGQKFSTWYDYQSGVITLEQAREVVGDEVDNWGPQTGSKSPAGN